jgi:hypothetical protein
MSDGTSQVRDKAHSDHTLEAARITARQAIIVAIITSMAGVLGAAIGYFANKSSSPAPSSPAPSVLHRVSIDSVRFDEDGPYAVRIVADVNGQAYSYPSRAVWADIGPTMAKEEFPLLPAQEYRIHFSAYLRLPNGEVEMLQSQVLQLAPPGIELHYELFRMDKEFSRGDTHGAKSSLFIEYHVQ